MVIFTLGNALINASSERLYLQKMIVVASFPAIKDSTIVNFSEERQ
ncbi:hypothetical protein NT06LI_1478 [Listeria innocua FSL J1-023]|nr:hypothetical protein NT06LI_1478 [Listeria innocua FSL J1-023]